MPARRDANFVTVAHAGFAGEPPVLSHGSEVATRLISGHTLTLDDPLSQRRLDPADVEFGPSEIQNPVGVAVQKRHAHHE